MKDKARNALNVYVSPPSITEAEPEYLCSFHYPDERSHRNIHPYVEINADAPFCYGRPQSSSTSCLNTSKCKLIQKKCWITWGGKKKKKKRYPFQNAMF